MIPASEVAVVLLAAGGSRRFGARDKLLALLAGEPLVVHAARRIVALAPAGRLAVCGDPGSEPARLLAALGFEIVPNPRAEHSLSTSLACGIERAASTPAQAALVCLADMPFVSCAHLRALLTRFDTASAPIVASSSGAIPTPPAVFARALFGDLQAATGDSGARPLLRGAATVTASAAELRDIDRPEDLG